MHAIVKIVFSNFTAKFEGSIPHMYLDVLGLVTVARGNLIDPIGMAMSLPFEREGVRVSQSEIAAEWRNVKARQDLARVGARSFKAITTLRLSDKSIEDLVIAKLVETETYLKKRFTDFENWPADAQLGLLSMAWAMGPGFKFKNFEAACIRGDFITAAASCKMNEAGNPGLIPRNIANAKLFTNAARVLASPTAYSKKELFWPTVLPAEKQFVPEEPKTDPSIPPFEVTVDFDNDDVVTPRLPTPVEETKIIPVPDEPIQSSSWFAGFLAAVIRFIFSLLGKTTNK